MTRPKEYELPRLSLKDLLAEGFMQTGRHKELYWRDQTGAVVLQAHITLAHHPLLLNYLKLEYRHPTTQDQIMVLDRQQCHYGGFRFFARCPTCHRRGTVMFFATWTNPPEFICRHCANIIYWTQNVSKQRKWEAQIDEITEKLETNPHLHWETRRKLRYKRYTLIDRLQNSVLGNKVLGRVKYC